MNEWMLGGLVVVGTIAVLGGANWIVSILRGVRKTPPTPPTTKA